MILIATLIAGAFIFGLLARHIGLPPLVGYLLAGFLLNFYELGPQESDMKLLENVAHAGVLLLLFGVGLKLRWKSLLSGEVLIGSLLHMALVILLLTGILYTATDWTTKELLLSAVALSFSSTVVAAKVLEGKRELRAFHGRVAIGILIMQDLVAVAILSFLGGGNVEGHGLSLWTLGLFGLPLLRPLIHRLLDWSGHEEVLVLYGLLLALVAGAMGFEKLGLSTELGALVLGTLLADHKRAQELSNALWSLKEILLVGFFLQIGLNGTPDLQATIGALLLTLFLPLKALLFFLILLLFGLRARSSFLASLSLSTYSEFGLIIVSTAGQSDGLALLALSVAFSFVCAAPLNRLSHQIYQRLEKYLLPLELKKRHPDDEPIHLGNSHYLIMGMGRVGTGAYDFLSQRRQRVAGLDSDPARVEKHLKQHRRVLYADAEDPGLWHNLHLGEIHAVMLAMPDVQANIMAARQLRRFGYRGFISATAVFDEELESIRQAGADVAYNFYNEAGVGFAEHVWEHLHPSENTYLPP